MAMDEPCLYLRANRHYMERADRGLNADFVVEVAALVSVFKEFPRVDGVVPPLDVKLGAALKVQRIFHCHL